MRLTLPRPPLRAVILILAGWIGLRMWVLWPEGEPVGQALQVAETLPIPLEHPAIPAPPTTRLAVAPPRRYAVALPARRTIPIRPTPAAAIDDRIATSFPPPSAEPVAYERTVPVSAPALSPPTPPMSRWSGWAYSFYRPGGGRTLAAGGQLGGSQAAARLSYRLDDRLAVAARAYAPLESGGAEAALGLDATIFGRIHAVVERRVGIDRAGRDAWAAYATGGVYREAGRLVVDAYAQAGLVGARRRDAFVDGAVRAGLRLGGRGPIVGAGAWGATQPGAARIDIGPRAAWTEPRTRLTASVEGRFRIAGAARPGSGVALTLARDF